MYLLRAWCHEQHLRCLIARPIRDLDDIENPHILLRSFITQILDLYNLDSDEDGGPIDGDVRSTAGGDLRGWLRKILSNN